MCVIFRHGFLFLIVCREGCFFFNTEITEKQEFHREKQKPSVYLSAPCNSVLKKMHKGTKGALRFFGKQKNDGRQDHSTQYTHKNGQ